MGFVAGKRSVAAVAMRRRQQHQVGDRRLTVLPHQQPHCGASRSGPSPGGPPLRPWHGPPAGSCGAPYGAPLTGDIRGGQEDPDYAPSLSKELWQPHRQAEGHRWAPVADASDDDRNPRGRGRTAGPPPWWPRAHSNGGKDSSLGRPAGAPVPAPVLPPPHLPLPIGRPGAPRSASPPACDLRSPPPEAGSAGPESSSPEPGPGSRRVRWARTAVAHLQPPAGAAHRPGARGWWPRARRHVRRRV